MADEVRLIDANKLLEVIEDAIDIENDGEDVEKSKFIILGLIIAKKYINQAATVEAQPTKQMLKLIEHIQMMLVTIYDTGGYIQSEDMKSLIETSDRLKELVKENESTVRANDNRKST